MGSSDSNSMTLYDRDGVVCVANACADRGAGNAELDTEGDVVSRSVTNNE